MRTWYKTIPPKLVHKEFGMYSGEWMPQMDRCWESSDGYSVRSRQIRTDWGTVEHVTIQILGGFGDVPWAVKQEIKDELFGRDRTAIEVFPSKKNLIDVCDIYHLWVLPKDFKIPFGIHPLRDPKGTPVERGYDYNLEKANEWVNSPERNNLLNRGDKNELICENN